MCWIDAKGIRFHLFRWLKTTFAPLARRPALEGRTSLAKRLEIEPFQPAVLFQTGHPFGQPALGFRRKTVLYQVLSGCDDLEFTRPKPCCMPASAVFEDQVPGEAVCIRSLV